MQPETPAYLWDALEAARKAATLGEVDDAHGGSQSRLIAVERDARCRAECPGARSAMLQMSAMPVEERNAQTIRAECSE